MVCGCVTSVDEVYNLLCSNNSPHCCEHKKLKRMCAWPWCISCWVLFVTKDGICLIASILRRCARCSSQQFTVFKNKKKKKKKSVVLSNLTIDSLQYWSYFTSDFVFVTKWFFLGLLGRLVGPYTSPIQQWMESW